MKLRYMREQRERAREMLERKDAEIEDRKNATTSSYSNLKSSRKRTKFQLDDSDSEDGGGAAKDPFMGFTHKGKRLLIDEDGRDDFNEHISQDSEDDKHDRSKRKGFLTNEMVARMNFGGGEEDGENGDLNAERPQVKKTRKEVFEEIIEKSKNYDAARKELKQINLEMSKELNNDFADLLKRLKYKKDCIDDPQAYNNDLLQKMAKKAADSKKPGEKPKEKELSYDQIAHSLKSQVKQAAVKPYDQLTDKEKAVQRRLKLQELHEKVAKGDSKKGQDTEQAGLTEDR